MQLDALQATCPKREKSPLVLEMSEALFNRSALVVQALESVAVPRYDGMKYARRKQREAA